MRFGDLLGDLLGDLDLDLGLLVAYSVFCVKMAVCDRVALELGWMLRWRT